LDTFFTISKLRPGESLCFATKQLVIVLEGAVAVQRRLFGGTASEQHTRRRAAHLLRLLNNKPSATIAREPPQHCFQTSTVRLCCRVTVSRLQYCCALPANKLVILLERAGAVQSRLFGGTTSNDAFVRAAQLLRHLNNKPSAQLHQSLRNTAFTPAQCGFAEG
jgi:hypothetical protein